jgi:hypothetical protein
MIHTCGDFQRLLLHHRVLRSIAHRALSAAASPSCHHSASLAPYSSLSKRFSTSKCPKLQRGTSRTLCIMSEVAHAPPQAENGAAESEVEALKRQIAELQVRDRHPGAALPEPGSWAYFLNSKMAPAEEWTAGRLGSS